MTDLEVSWQIEWPSVILCIGRCYNQCVVDWCYAYLWQMLFACMLLSYRRWYLRQMFLPIVEYLAVVVAMWQMEWPLGWIYFNLNLLPTILNLSMMVLWPVMLLWSYIGERAFRCSWPLSKCSLWLPYISSSHSTLLPLKPVDDATLLCDRVFVFGSHQ